MFFFKRKASAVEISLISTFREISRQFFINFLFFNFIITCVCEAPNSPTKKENPKSYIKSFCNTVISQALYHYPWKLNLLKVDFLLLHLHIQEFDYH